MIDATTTATMTPAKFPHFRTHKRLVDTSTLTSLSHDAIKAFLYISYRLSLCRGFDVEVADSTLVIATGMALEQVDAARYELSVAGLLTYDLLDGRTNYILIP
jgi:hypothetical protein